MTTHFHYYALLYKYSSFYILILTLFKFYILLLIMIIIVNLLISLIDLILNVQAVKWQNCIQSLNIVSHKSLTIFLHHIS